MANLLNSAFEAGLRSLLVLYAIRPLEATIDRIAAYDFMSIYGEAFDISSNNLHGDNVFNFSEFPTKRINCVDGIKEMVLNGFINVNQAKNGFLYSINNSGLLYVDSLFSDYKNQYIQVVNAVHNRHKSENDLILLAHINNTAVINLRRSK